MNLSVKRLTSTAKLPTYAHVGDAGLDLYSDEAVSLAAQQRAVVKTGIALAIPEGAVGLVWDKSGLAVTAGLTTLAGVIDSGYRGEVQVVLFNSSNVAYQISAGQKIAQLLIQPINRAVVVEVSELTNTMRGQAGFGSTGL